MEEPRRYEVRESTTPDPPYRLHAPDGRVVESVSDYLQELLACDCSPATVKAYVYALLDWFRFLDTVGIAWQAARSTHVRAYVLQLRGAENPYRRRQRPDSPAPGVVNPRTGKPSLAAGYQPATINQRLSVVKGYYAYHGGCGIGPRQNPVPGSGDARRNAHHPPDDPWLPVRRAPYRQKQPAAPPRAISDELWAAVFGCLTSNRDRAIFSLLLSAGCRAGELLQLTDQDVDWGRQCVRLISKGSREAQWVAASPDACHWLRRWVVDRGAVPAGEPLWWTLRHPRRPLAYQALRKILMRVNQQLGTNLVLHDFRHTCALRLASDPQVPLIYVQAHLRHRHLATTQRYLRARDEEVIASVQAHQRGDREAPPPGDVWHYDADDLAVLLGREERPV